MLRRAGFKVGHQSEWTVADREDRPVHLEKGAYSDGAAPHRPQWVANILRIFLARVVFNCGGRGTSLLRLRLYALCRPAIFGLSRSPRRYGRVYGRN
jgi:hypothetical protein